MTAHKRGPGQYLIVQLTDGSYTLEPDMGQPYQAVVFSSDTLYEAEDMIKALREEAVKERASRKAHRNDKQGDFFGQ